jgi:2-hydroxychromene-2-carboxylate isomerase
MKKAEWYFDFVSPFSYLQATRLPGLAKLAQWQLRPVLFGALLNHWGTIGPAELGPKRRWTYEHCLWIARRERIPFRMPREHPFNPLPLLRLALVGAADGVATYEIVARLLRFVWQDGYLPSDQAAWQSLLDEVGVDAAQLGAPEIKDALRANGERALRAEVFGVPTTVSEGRRFWGFDGTDMLIAWLNDDPWFASDELAAITGLPVGIERRRG